MLEIEKVSRCRESSVEQSKQDEPSNEPTEADSDSGDSLFITQKPVARPVRSGRQRRCSLWSGPTSVRDLEESEDDSLSSSHEESKTDKGRQRKKYRLPKYSFPFLTERKCKPRSTLLSVSQGISLHYSAMGGFFNCVRELWQDYQRGDDVESSLPTVDIDGDISPLSEEEEERPVEEDIKVVERKRFVAPSKVKCQQTWCSQLNQQRGKASNGRQDTSSRSQLKTLRTIPAEASISSVTPLDTEISDAGKSSCEGLIERESSDTQVTSERHFLAQTETPNTQRRLSRGNIELLFQQKVKEVELCDPHKLQRSPRQHALGGRKASPTVTETLNDVFHTDDLSHTGPAEDEPENRHLLHGPPDFTRDNDSDSVCNMTRLKKKADKGDRVSVEEGKDQSRDSLHVAASVNVEVEETPTLAWQTGVDLDCNGKNSIVNSSHNDNVLRQKERDIPDSKRKIKKKKRKKTTAENEGQEVDGNHQSDVRMEDSVSLVSWNVEKKKRKRSVEGVEQLQPSTVAEPLNGDDDDAAIKRKKKKRKKKKRHVVTDECEEEEVLRTADVRPLSTCPVDTLEESGNCLENTAASPETLQTSYVRRKKHKKKQPLTNDGEEEPVTLTQSTEMSLKKKKEEKKKKKKEKVDISSSTEETEKVENVNDYINDNTQKTKEGLEDQNAELTKKKKKKKKTSAVSSRNISEDAVAQSDDSVSVQEKEKKRTSSFLVADAVESDGQTRGEQQHSPSGSEAARVCGASAPGVSAGDCETESAEIDGNLEGSDPGLRKQKKKRKRRTSAAQDDVENDQGQEFEEPRETRLRKKKRKRNKSESETPTERLENPEDAVVVQKKKKKGKDRTCNVIQESPLTTSGDIESERSTLNSCGSESHRKKGKRLTLGLVTEGLHGPGAEVSRDSSTSPSSEAPGNQALSDVRSNKKKKKMKSTDNVLLEGRLLTESAELEKKAKERKKHSAVPTIVSSSPALPETSLPNADMSSSDKIIKNKHLKVKRRLHNSSEDFLTDC